MTLAEQTKRVVGEIARRVATWAGALKPQREAAQRGRPEPPPETLLETFERAFRDSIGSCRGDCGGCGKQFINPGNGWDFDEGEVDRAIAAGAIVTSYAIEFITFEGCTRVIDCDCWQKRAQRIAVFLKGHDEQIGAFLRGEAERAAREAARAGAAATPPPGTIQIIEAGR